MIDFSKIEWIQCEHESNTEIVSLFNRLLDVVEDMNKRNKESKEDNKI